MDLDQFRQHIEQMKPLLREWGAMVEQELKARLHDAGIMPQIITSRVKETSSAIGKISRKRYTNPLSEMTDLVGVRVVVLLTPELRRVKDLIEECPLWEARLVRDPDEEMESKPENFDYQSVHFELRNKEPLTIDDLVLPAGTCCELQARTLMQHTYAEVVHDNIYKAQWDAPARARRYVASSAALIDTADHLFCETMSFLEEENQKRGDLLDQLCAIHDGIIPGANGRDQKLNMLVISEFEDMLSKESIEDLKVFLVERQYVIERIQARQNCDPFWLQPVSVLAYWLVKTSPRTVFRKWPFASSQDALRQVYSDLGENP